MAAAFNELMECAAILQNAQLYIGIEKSKNEYSIEGSTTLPDFTPSARLNPSNAADDWYFECISGKNEYNLKIDIDKNSNTWHLWINHKVMENEELAGVLCSGIPLSDVTGKIFGQYDSNKIRGYIIDKNGIIQSDSSANGIYSGKPSSHIIEENSDPAFIEALISYLDRIDGFFDDHIQPEIVKLSKGPYQYASIEPIGHTDWSVIIFHNKHSLSRVANLLPFLLGIFATLFLFIIWRDTRNAILKRQRLEKLLNVINGAAAALLQSETEKFGSDLLQCMRMMAEAVDVDRVYIWKNIMEGDRLYCTRQYLWSGNVTDQQSADSAENIPYSEFAPGWEKTLSRGECIIGRVCDMPESEKVNLVRRGILSIFILPVFRQDQFWGFVGYDDCYHERNFSENELSILRSGGMVLANALLRNEMTKDIYDTAIRLEEANRAKSNFLATVSHEMRTPLNAIIGLSEITLGSEKLDREDNSNLEKINNAGITLLSIVNDILDISKIDAGKFSLNPIEYDTPSLLNDSITQSTLHLGEKPIRFILNINENLPARLYGDDLRLKQIFNNLLTNAFKYTKKGTVELSINFEREEDTVWIIAKIIDTGIGIRKKDLKKLFSSYVQIDAESNRKIEGTGLGLAITKRFVDLMEGSINVESEYGKGSTFTVKLKQKFVTDAVIGAEVVNSLNNFNYSEYKRFRHSLLTRIKLPYARVLVVDDVLTNLEVARGMLKPYGMKIDCVTSGEAAVEAISTGNVKYNAVFMDHMMPGMDGIEAARIIREKIGTEYAKTVPIIALTANAIMGNDKMFLSKGFQAFLSKPIEIERLDAVIKEWVRDKELEKTYIEQEINAGGQIPDKKKFIDRQKFLEMVSEIDLEKCLTRFSGDEESFLQVLRSYVTNTPALLKKIKVMNKDNLDDYIVSVHGIKGSSNSIYAEIIGSKAEALEKAAKEGKIEYIIINNTVFIEAVEKLIHAISDILKLIDEENPKQKKDKPDRELLTMLLAACEAYDMDGVDAAIGKIEEYEYETDGGLTVWLRENVDQMNFVQIKEKLLALSE